MSLRLLLTLYLALISFAALAKDKDRSAIDEILARGPVSPGLFLEASAPQAHEIRSARELAEFLDRTLGYKTVLLTGSKTFGTPGFDGLILDEADQPVANFSLKTSHRNRERILGQIVDLGLSKMFHFSKLENWQRAVNVVSRTLSQLRRHQGEMQRSLQILQPDSNRPQWLILHLTAPDVSEETILSLKEKTRGVTQTLLVLDRTSVFVFQNGEETNLEALKPCESHLKSE